MRAVLVQSYRSRRDVVLLAPDVLSIPEALERSSDPLPGLDGRDVLPGVAVLDDEETPPGVPLSRGEAVRPLRLIVRTESA